MRYLDQFIFDNVERGACRCGRCVDAPDNPEAEQPKGHTVDVYFFNVALRPGSHATAEEFRRLIEEHDGSHVQCNPLDGRDHSFIELGAWIGDQGAALMFIGLGELLGLWRAVTPNMVPGLSKERRDALAGGGWVSLMPSEMASRLFGSPPPEPSSTTEAPST